MRRGRAIIEARMGVIGAGGENKKYGRNRYKVPQDANVEEREKQRMQNSLPGLANMLINGVSSEGLRRCAMCSLRPAGPGTPPTWGC